MPEQSVEVLLETTLTKLPTMLRFQIQIGPNVLVWKAGDEPASILLNQLLMQVFEIVVAPFDYRVKICTINFAGPDFVELVTGDIAIRNSYRTTDFGQAVPHKLPVSGIETAVACLTRDSLLKAQVEEVLTVCLDLDGVQHFVFLVLGQQRWIFFKLQLGGLLFVMLAGIIIEILVHAIEDVK